MKNTKTYRVTVWTKTGTVEAGSYQATSKARAIAEAKSDRGNEAAYAQRVAKSERGRWMATAQ